MIRKRLDAAFIRLLAAKPWQRRASAAMFLLEGLGVMALTMLIAANAPRGWGILAGLAGSIPAGCLLAIAVLLLLPSHRPPSPPAALYLGVFEERQTDMESALRNVLEQTKAIREFVNVKYMNDVAESFRLGREVERRHRDN